MSTEEKRNRLRAFASLATQEQATAPTLTPVPTPKEDATLDPLATQEKQDKEQETARKEAQASQADANETLVSDRARVAATETESQNGLRKTAARVRSSVGRVGDFFGRIPVAGGIGLLVVILLLLVCVILPVNANGDTRLKLLFFTLLNKTTLNGASGQAGLGSADFGQTPTISQAPQTGGVGSADFGQIAQAPQAVISPIWGNIGFSR